MRRAPTAPIMLALPLSSGSVRTNAHSPSSPAGVRRRSVPSWQALGESEMCAVALEAALAALQADQRAFGHRRSAARILFDRGTDRFAVPIFRMLDVEPGVEREIAPLLAAQSNALQRGGGAGAAAGRRQFDGAQRADAVPGIAPSCRHGSHRIGKREAFPDGVLDR